MNMVVQYGKLRAVQKGMCALCGSPLIPEDGNVDHIIPRSAGGPNARWNLRAVHKICNSKRGSDQEPGLDEIASVRAYKLIWMEGIPRRVLPMFNAPSISAPVDFDTVFREIHRIHAEHLSQYVSASEPHKVIGIA